jgi:hypothetical protein
MRTVRLGFELPSGEPVSIPLRHMVVTGQTQEAGKTTALEALVARSGVKAVAFITKRGEGSFADARVIPPYFREQADWQFVAAILEASRGEKLKFERAWIIRASKGARTLADVQRNVLKALETAKGLSADVYLTLNAYLEVVVPQIERVRWAERVDLAPGVNAMDLTRLDVEMQHLVIRSTVEWVLQKEEDTVVVVPEAWKFIPQGRGTPVKLAAEAYIRQAAGLRNYLWLDSQDIAGVEKMILKSVPVWILGVQRESNEVKRTLDQIPAGIKKPKPEAVATLKLGEFFACYGSHVVKTYAQPRWMSDAEAQAVAEGRIDRPEPGTTPRREAGVTPEEADELRQENQRLRDRIADLERMLHRPESHPLATSGHKPDGHKPEPKAERRAAAEREVSALTPLDMETVYTTIVRRLMAEAPGLLRVLTVKPELEVHVTQRTVDADGDTWLGRTAQLLKDGFFDQPRKSLEVFHEAKRRGATGIATRADEACKKLLAMGFVTHEDAGFQAVPGMKVRVTGGTK